MSNTRTLELDISKEGAGTCIKVGQGDDGGTTIKALIYDNGAEFSLSGATAWLVVLLPNKRNYYRGQCSVSGNAATITVDESRLCSVSGYTDEAYFTITKNGATYSTERFAIEILRSALDGQQPAQNWDDAVQDLIDRGETAVKNANAAAATANGAAEDATAAAQNALNIANSIAAIEPPSDDEVQELREENATLAHAVTELQDDYLYLGETLYVPSSRVTAQSGESITLSQSSVSGETATLN
jgi:hypothetical protein